MSFNFPRSEETNPEGCVVVGDVLELLLSAAHLHKRAAATVTSLLGEKTQSTTEGKNGPSSVAATPTPSTNPNNVNCNNSTTYVSGSVKPGSGSSSADKENNISASEIWSRLVSNPATKNPEITLKILRNIIQDGLLDSILPYVVSSLNLASDPSKSFISSVTNPPNKSLGIPNDSIPPTAKKSSTSGQEKDKNKDNIKPSNRSPTKAKEDVLVKMENEKEVPEDEKSPEAEAKQGNLVGYFSDNSYDKGPPIVIHVCDEAHGLRQDFTCARDLLINHIGYFAEVTAGQRLEDVDISVHCDVNIFDWLLKWVKKQDNPTLKSPVLEPKNSISILISADFLKMNPLADEVLKYIHDNANRILESQVNVSCLTDSLLTRLSRLFTHWELESLKDPRDKLQNKIYARFVQMLCDVNPSVLKGIYRTAATIYKCSDCGKIVGRGVERLTDCLPSNTCVTSSGGVFYVHTRDSNWALTEHVKLLKSELKSWRLVYWRLWGQVHFLPCSTCGAVFQGCEMKLCRYHRSEPSFGVETLSSLISSGGDTYACCGKRALRFSPLPLRNGCQFTEHTVQLTRRHNDIWGPIPQIYDDLLTFQLLICVEPPSEEINFQKVLWRGVSIVPASKTTEKSFLDRSWLAEHRVEKAPSTSAERNPVEGPHQKALENSSESPTGALPSPVSDCESETSEDEEEGIRRSRRRRKKNLPPKFKTMILRKAARAKKTIAYEIVTEPGWRWDITRSTRYNQDTQRDRELRVFRELTSWLALATPTAQDTANVNVPSRTRHKADRVKKESGPDPGSFYRLEAEFKDKFASHEKGHGSSHSVGIFRAKVQAISRIKMRLRHRTAFSATR